MRFGKVEKFEKVYCPDGTAHLVDQEDLTFVIDLPNKAKADRC